MDAQALAGVSADAPLVSAVVVTRDRREDALTCLTSIAAQRYPALEMIVVVNGSADTTAAAIRDRFPTARVVELDRNYGVAGGRNRGMELARGEIALLVDDDARLVGEDAAGRVVDRFVADPTLACVALDVRNAESGWTERSAIPRADKRLVAEVFECAYFCGAGFALRVQSFREAGGFWEPLFYAGEELDLSYRLLDRGERIVWAKDVAVAHAPATEGRTRGQWFYYSARNRAWVAARNLPWPSSVTTALLWWGWTLATALQHGEARAAVRGVRDSIRGLPAAVRTRSVIRRATIERVRLLAGRVWY